MKRDTLSQEIWIKSLHSRTTASGASAKAFLMLHTRCVHGLSVLQGFEEFESNFKKSKKLVRAARTDARTKIVITHTGSSGTRRIQCWEASEKEREECDGASVLPRDTALGAARVCSFPLR